MVHPSALSRFVLSAAALTVALSPPCSADQAETLVQVVETPFAVHIGYGQHTSITTISPATDIDRYTFCAEAGDEVRIIVQATYDAMDPRVELLDPQGVELQEKTCDHTCSFIMSETITVDGTYTILVRDVGVNDVGSYRLQLEKTPPKLNMPSLLYGTPATDMISPATDEDWFLIPMEAGTSVVLALQATFDSMDPHLALFDPTGVFVDSKSCDHTCSVTMPVMPMLTGVYRARVRDLGTNESGKYILSVDCTFGNCPFLTAASPWEHVGGSVAGALGHPVLIAEGSLEPNSSVSLTLSKVEADVPALLVIGFSKLDLPYKGGTLVPATDLVFGLMTSSNGNLVRGATWPAGFSNTEFYCQYWVPDDTTLQGVAASNAVRGLTPM